MKLGIVVGHTRTRPGAHSDFLSSSEYPWNTDLANRIVAANSSTVEVKIFFRDGHGIAGAYRDSDAWGSKATVELHFNSSDNWRASGCGVLYHGGSARGREYATLLQTEMKRVLGLPDWPGGTGGVATPFQASGVERRGETSLTAGSAPATLIEPFFGSNPTDSDKAARNKDALAQAIMKASVSFLT